MSSLVPMVYILAAITSLACALLLARGYFRSRVRLLMWSSLFFAALTADNVLLYVDLSVFPEVKMVLVRHSLALIGLALLLFGLIWDSE